MAENGKLPAYRSSLPIAVDAMGGDRGLEVQIEGAVQAYREFGARSILVGPQDALSSRLDALGAKQYPIGIQHASDVITMDESPAMAVRRKPESSLCVACNLVQLGDASAVLSSGNSGALMAAGRLIFGLLPGIERPAIATLIPVAGDETPNVMLDSGANVDCHAQNLVQFAVMGAIYHSSLFDSHKPRIALLSNGSEPSKGTDVIRAASMILAKMEGLNFVGYVEGRDITASLAEVIVCDGFVGNIVLKSMEGAVTLVFQQLMHEGKKGIVRKMGLGLSRGTLREVFSGKFDYKTHGGAPLLGLKKLALVLHGSSDSRAVKNAVRLADSFVVCKMTEKITAALLQLEEQLPDMDSEIISAMFSGEHEVRDGRGRKAKLFAKKNSKSTEDELGSSVFPENEEEETGANSEE